METHFFLTLTGTGLNIGARRGGCLEWDGGVEEEES